MSPILPGIVASGISGHLFTPDGSAYEIASYTVPTGGLASIMFSIPPGYRHMQIQFAGTGGATYGDIEAQFNGDNQNNYQRHYMYGNGGGTPGSGYSGAINRISIGYGSDTSTNYPVSGFATILDYASTTKNKTLSALTGQDTNGGGHIFMFSGAWNSLSPITSMTIFNSGGNNIPSNSKFTLIGYK